MTHAAVEKPKHRLFAAALWPHVTTATHRQRLAQLRRPGLVSIAQSLGESIVLHDEIWIPTNDFLNVALLLCVLGENGVRAVVEAGVLRFVRVQGSFGYDGNGQGLSALTTYKQDGQSSPMSATPEWSIRTTVAIGGLTLDDEPGLVRCIEESTDTLRARELIEPLREITHSDALHTLEIRKALNLDDRQIDRLPGLGSNQIRVLGDRPHRRPNDGIDLLLALAYSNLELLLASRLECGDVSSRLPVGNVLASKLRRIPSVAEKSAAYRRLSSFVRAPDIGRSLYAGEVSMEDVISLCETTESKQFRDWFHSNANADQDEITRQYISVLETKPWMSRVPAKTIRWLGTNAISLLVGALDPVAGASLGLAVSAADTFLLERLFAGYSPKLFVDKLRALPMPGQSKGETVRSSQSDRKRRSKRRTTKMAKRKNRR